MNAIPSEATAFGSNAEFWPIVIVESPFAGEMVQNAIYVQRACFDCLSRGEVPFASHGFFPEFLDELKPEHRELGITAGYAFWRTASKIVFYCDRGQSSGMNRARERAKLLGFVTEDRYLD